MSIRNCDEAREAIDSIFGDLCNTPDQTKEELQEIAGYIEDMIASLPEEM